MERKNGPVHTVDVDPDETVTDAKGYNLPMTMLFRIVVIEKIPADEVWFMRDNQRIARIVNIGPMP